MKNLRFLLVAIVIVVAAHHRAALAQGTAFTYQGRLDDGGAPVNGSYAFQFTVLDGANGNPVGTPVAISPVDVSNGLFTVSLDFGAGVFTGAARWLSIEVKTNGNNTPFVLLTPAQPIQPAPYSIYAKTTDAAGIIGVIPAASLGGLAASNFWQTAGNAGTTAGLNFLGTTDNQPLELRANGQRVLWLDNSGSAPNLIGGHAANSIGPFLSGVTIAGGGDAASFNLVNANWGTVGGGSGNSIGSAAASGTIAGGASNQVANYAFYSAIAGGLGNIAAATHGAIGGGEQNWIKPFADYSTIAGGYFNTNSGGYATIGGGAENLNSGAGSVIAGGRQNTIDSGFQATIGGGWQNTIQAGADIVTIGGGWGNTIQAEADYATIGGGTHNTVESDAAEATVSGGANNAIHSGSSGASIGGGEANAVFLDAPDATIGGGRRNIVLENSALATVGGGFSNRLAGVAATIPGGSNNLASGTTSLAAGNRAQAVHNGAFVWSDSQDADFTSTAINQFAVRAQNGVMIQGSTTALDLRGDGAIRVAGAGVGSGGPVFIHRAAAGNITDHITAIDHPLANGDPNAILLVTHNFSADTSATPYEPNTVGVWYNGSRWTIYHENTAVAMPEGRAFNVMIIKP